MLLWIKSCLCSSPIYKTILEKAMYTNTYKIRQYVINLIWVLQNYEGVEYLLWVQCPRKPLNNPASAHPRAFLTFLCVNIAFACEHLGLPYSHKERIIQQDRSLSSHLADTDVLCWFSYPLCCGPESIIMQKAKATVGLTLFISLF